MTDILVNAGGILLMLAIVGWFWLPGKHNRQPKAGEQSGRSD